MDCLPLIPYFDTSVDVPGAPLPPKSNILGTDDVKRVSLTRNLWISHINNVYLLGTIASSLLGILAGAVQGYFEDEQIYFSRDL